MNGNSTKFLVVHPSGISSLFSEEKLIEWKQKLEEHFGKAVWFSPALFSEEKLIEWKLESRIFLTNHLTETLFSEEKLIEWKLDITLGLFVSDVVGLSLFSEEKLIEWKR